MSNPKNAKLEKNLFNSFYQQDTSCEIYFDLDDSISRQKNPIFETEYSKNYNFSHKKLKFFLGGL